ERVDRCLELALEVIGDGLLVADALEHVLVLGAQRSEKTFFELANLVDSQLVEIAVNTGENHGNLLFRLQRRELRLLQKFSQARTAVQKALRCSVKIGTELCEGGHFTILGKLALDRTGNLLHGLDLGRRTNARNRQADVNSRTDTLIEQVGFEEDLAVGDRDHVGRNEGRNVVALRFDDRQSRQRASAVFVVELCSAFEKTGVQVENVARISFAARRTTQQERHLTVGNSLLGQVVIADEGVLAVVTEVFAHRAARKRCEILHRSRIGSGSRDNDRIFQGAAFFENLDELGNSRTLLADGDVDAVQLVLVRAVVVDRLLVQEGVEDDGGLAGLTVTDDQLALAAAHRDQGVDGLEARRHRLVNRLARDDARRLDVNAAAFLGLDRALAVDRVAESVDNAAEQFRTDRNVNDCAGALDDVAFLDVAVGTEDNDTDIIAFKVQRHAANATGEFDHFTGLNIVQTIDAGDTVADGQNLPDLGDLSLRAAVLDLLFQDSGNFRGADVHQPTSFSASLREESFVRRDVSI